MAAGHTSYSHVHTSYSLMDDVQDVQDMHDGFEERETPDFLPSDSGVFANGDLFSKPPTRVDEPASLAMIKQVSVGVTLALPRETMLKFLAQHQLLAVWYIMNQHALMLPDGKRSGFFLGDGPGVGKTRVVAAVIYENYIHRGTKALWLSANMDLMPPAQRDLCNIGAGRLRCVSGACLLKEGGLQEADIMFATYKMLSQRVQQVVEWLTCEFDGVVVLDECHLAKNLARGGSQAARAVATLQDQLPQARVIYVSATGASQPSHFLNMSRLGLWGEGTAFPCADDFIKQMNKDGISSMQLVAAHMKEKGQYLARTLSLDGCSFQIVHAGVSDEFGAMYDRCVKLWEFMEDNLHEFRCTDDGGRTESVTKRSSRSTISRNFFAIHRLFFHYLLIAAKVPEVVALVQRWLEAGYACIIGLQKTGQAGISAQEGKDDGLVSSAQVTLRRFVETHYKPGNLDNKTKVLQQIEDLELPPNPLDDIIHQLGGHTKVAEITSRSHRMEKRSKPILAIKKNTDSSSSSSTKIQDETWVSVPRQESKASELQSFQGGKKMTAILSDAGGVGIGLHCDPLCDNQAKRMHIMMELPDTAEKLVQQIGRSHRSNEVTPPELVLVMTGLGGDKKSAALIARRMQAMGALTQGDRRSSGQLGSDFFDLGIDDGPGAAAAEAVAKLLYTQMLPGTCPIEPPSVIQEAYPAPTSADVWRRFATAHKSTCWLRMERLRGSSDVVVTFFNCLMGATVLAQRHIYAVFSACLEHFASEARRQGTAAVNILDVAGSDVHVDASHTLWTCPESGAVTTHVCVSTDRGLDFAAAAAMLTDHPEQQVSGFYVARSRRDEQAHQTPLVVLVLARRHQGTGGFKLEVFRPNTGRIIAGVTMRRLQATYKKAAGADEVQRHWQSLRDYYRNRCGHKPGKCKNPKTCKFKISRIQHDMIMGSLLPFWKVLEHTLGKRRRIVRVEPSCGHAPFLGVPVPTSRLQEVGNVIREGGPFFEAMLRRAPEGRLAVSPLYVIESVVAVKRLVRVNRVEEVSFQLPGDWQSNGKQCVAVLYEVPALVDVDPADKTPLLAAPWPPWCQRLIVNGKQVDTSGDLERFRERQTYIPKMVALDNLLRTHSRNRLRFFSKQGDRACIAVLLVSPRGVEDATRAMSVVEDEAVNLAWGQQLLNANGDDEEVKVVRSMVTLRDPLSTAKIGTPVRGKLCQHFACFDLQTYLEYNAKHDSWECPVCRAAIAPSQVQVCRQFEKMLEASQDDDDSSPMLPLAATEMGDDALPEEAGAGDNAAGQQAQVLPDTVQKYETAGTLEATGLWEDLPKAQEMYLDPDLALQALADSVVVRRQRKHVARAGQSHEKSDEGEMSLSEDSEIRPRRRKRVARAGQSREKSDEGKMSLSEDSDTTPRQRKRVARTGQTREKVTRAK